MITPFDAGASARSATAFRVGQPVHVNAGAAWLPATITSITHTRIGVAYPRDTAVRFAGRVAPWVVRPADGARLQAVHEVRAGDEVVAFTGSVNTVAALRRCGDGWWAIAYLDGEQATIAPTAVLRLREPRPPQHPGQAEAGAGSRSGHDPAPLSRGRRARSDGQAPA